MEMPKTASTLIRVPRYEDPLVRAPFASGMPAAAVDIRRFLHRLARGAAILPVRHGAAASRMCALLVLGHVRSSLGFFAY